MAYWPHAPGGTSNGEEDAEGVEVLHRFFASYHACGPQDNAGKDPRISMERDIGFLKSKQFREIHTENTSGKQQFRRTIFVFLCILQLLSISEKVSEGLRG